MEVQGLNLYNCWFIILMDNPKFRHRNFNFVNSNTNTLKVDRIYQELIN